MSRLTLERLRSEWKSTTANKDVLAAREKWCYRLTTGTLVEACREEIRRQAPSEAADWFVETWPREAGSLRKFKLLSEHQHRVIPFVVRCARAIIEKGHWPSRSLPASALTDLASDLSRSTPPYGQAFCEAVIDYLWSPEEQTQEENPSEKRLIQTLFPLVLDGGGAEPRGVVAQFEVERVEGPGARVFLHPEHLFLGLDAAFQQAFKNARSLVLESAECSSPTCDLRVRIQAFNRDVDQQRLEQSEQLAGGSAGGALYLALRSAWQEQPVEHGFVTSFALRSNHQEASRQCQSIGYDVLKAIHLRDAGFHRFLIANDQSEDINRRAATLEINVMRAETVENAWELATGRLEDVLDFLDAQIRAADQVPVYFPADAEMDGVRVRVRVSTERLKHETIDASFEHALIRSPSRRDDLYRWRLGTAGVEDDHDREENAPKVEVLDWDDELRKTVRRGVIVGDPGFGKTWLLRHEAKIRAQEATAYIRERGQVEPPETAGRDPQPIIPVRLRLYDVAQRLVEQSTEGRVSLPRAIRAVLSDYKLPAKNGRPSRELDTYTLDLIERGISTGQVLLLMDALDEVPTEAGDQGARSPREVLLGELNRWVPNNPAARILVTSRVVGYTPPWPVKKGPAEREMELLPFDDPQIESFVEKWFESRDEVASAFLETLRGSPQIRGMAEIPLLLGFLCAVFDKTQSEDTDVELQHMHRHEIYEEILVRILKAEWHERERDYALKAARGPKMEIRRQLLEEVAYRFFVTDRQQFDPGELSNMMTEVYLGKDQEAISIKEREDNESEVGALIAELSEDFGLLIQAGEDREAPYLFLHLTIQEYLTASFIARWIDGNGWNADIKVRSGLSVPVRTLVDRKAWDPGWQQVIMLLAGCVENPVPLIEMLADEERDDLLRHRLALAAHCLAEAMPID